MLSVMFAQPAKEAFSYVIEGVTSENCSLVPLACSRPPTFYMDNAINI